jgi:hypothetical protein
MKHLFRLLLIMVLFTGVALAQSVTKGTIKGTIVDEGGIAIPGVMISIESDNLMGDQQRQSDVNGRFVFAELPPGIYELTAERNGFITVKKTNMNVNGGRNTIVNIELKLSTGAQDEMIIEETRQVVDTESGDRGSVLTKEFLQRIPAGRSYQSAVQMAAGVTGGSNPNVGGASFNENSYMLDGVNITDPVTGTFSLNFNFDAIEQIQVLTSAFDPEFGQNLGGAINVITESGGNTLEFVQDIRYKNGQWGPKLDATFAADGTQLAPTDFDSSFQTFSLSSKISGPIVRDKAWFLMSYSYNRSLIANIGIDLPRDFDGHYVFGKVTVQPTTAHRLSLSFQANPTTIDNTDQSDRFVDPSAQGRQAQGGFLFTGQWDWFISPEAFMETKATLQKLYLERYGVPCTHNQNLGYNPCEDDELENSIDFTTSPRLGLFNAFDSGNYVLYDFDDRWRAVLGTKFSLLQLEALGTHDIKAGVSTDLLWWTKIFGFSGNVIYYDLNEISYNPDTYQNYYWVEYNNPLQYNTYSNQLGFFIQDVYKPVSNVTIRFGTRYDRAIFRNDVGDKIIDVGIFGPRLSIIWDPWANQKTALKASVGRFNNPGRIGIADYLSQGDLGYKLTLGEYFGNFTSEAANTYFYVPVENTNTIYDKTTAPRSDEFLVGIEREIIRDFAAKAFFNGKLTRNLHAFDETNFIWDGTGYNVIGASDGTLVTQYRMRTPDIAQRRYYRADAVLEKAWSDRWAMQFNYSYSSSRGTVLGTPSSFLSVPQQVEYFINGYLGTDIRHDIAAGFTWDIPDDPWTTRLGAVFYMETGYPITRSWNNGNYADYGRSYFLKDTVGSYARTNTWWQLNMQIQQAIPVRKGKLFGVFELENVTNNRNGQFAYVSFDNRWIISYRVEPIRMTVGGRYEF